jgi:hypothetical protein
MATPTENLLPFPKVNPRKPRMARVRRPLPKQHSPARSVRIVAGLRLILAPWLYVLAGAGLLRLFGY